MRQSVLISFWQKFCDLFFSKYCHLVVQGKENLPSTPYILCSNHCSHLDTPVLMLSSGLPFHHYGMVAAKDYFFGPKKGKHWLGRLMHLLPLDRSPDRREMQHHMDLCRSFLKPENRVLIFYPEGTRSRTGELRKLKKGAALYAFELQIPLVPVHIQGTFESMPKGQKFPRPKRISVQIGTPIYARESGLAGLRKVTEELESNILKLRQLHG